jgi:hypothetical protein
MTRAYNTATTQQNSGGAVSPFIAGKNQCINGAFDVWQRGTSFSSNVYTADRWQTQTNKTLTVSRQAFTAGAAPVAGYEGTFFLRQTYSADGSYGALQTKLEDVRLFAGQTITLSYWAKADATYSNTPSVSQNFGTGGSSAVGTNGTTHNITTTWTRYSSTIILPSISGKTIGTNSFFMLQPILIESTGARTIDIWGVQLEAGPVATPFQTATGTIQGELAACQRYYQRFTGNTYTNLGIANAPSTTAGSTSVPLLTAMRVTPTAIDYGGAIRLTDQVSNFSVSALTLISVESSPQRLQVTATSSSLTQFRMYFLSANNDAAAYLGASAEL